MARLLAIFIWLMAVITVRLFVWPKWWLPEAVSAHSGSIDRQLKITLAVIGTGFLFTQVALGLAIWRFREKKTRVAAYSAGNALIDLNQNKKDSDHFNQREHWGEHGGGGEDQTHQDPRDPRDPRGSFLYPKVVWIELALTVVTGIVFVTLAITGQQVWARLQLNQAPPDAMRIEVTAQQFVWNFRYPGNDGKFGPTDPRLYNDADNSIGARPGPLGIESGDPAGKDDIVTGSMGIPAGRPINLTLRAKDVTHDFYVPALRLKHDAVPGMKIDIHFTAMKEGRYEIACAELCGQLHHQMRAILEVMSQSDYEEWLKQRSPKAMQ